MAWIQANLRQRLDDGNFGRDRGKTITITRGLSSGAKALRCGRPRARLHDLFDMSYVRAYMLVMQFAEEEVLELLQRYAAALVELAPGTEKAECARAWEKRFAEELAALRSKRQDAVTTN